jgi:hypothetical protein
MLAGKVDDKLPDVLRDAVVLTPYGVDYRYPGDYPEVTRGDAESALQLADCVRKEVLGRLPRDVLE